MLPSLVHFPARPPRHAHFGIRSIDPMHLLSTLQTPCYRGACKTRCWSVCSTLTRPDFHRQADTSFPNAHRMGLFQRLDHLFDALDADLKAAQHVPAREETNPTRLTRQFARRRVTGVCST